MPCHFMHICVLNKEGVLKPFVDLLLSKQRIRLIGDGDSFCLFVKDNACCRSAPSLGSWRIKQDLSGKCVMLSLLVDAVCFEFLCVSFIRGSMLYFVENLLSFFHLINVSVLHYILRVVWFVE